MALKGLVGVVGALGLVMGWRALRASSYAFSPTSDAELETGRDRCETSVEERKSRLRTWPLRRMR